MIDSIFQKRHRRHIKDLNIVPILDMLTTVIFFLLMSTSFMEYTKLTIPPSQTSVAASTAAKPPVAPKLLLLRQEGQLKLLLTWGGEKPGEAQEAFSAASPEERRAKILEASRKLAGDFSKEHPSEKTLQLGMAARIPYQDLISMMDGARELMPDIVLISQHEAEGRAR